MAHSTKPAKVPLEFDRMMGRLTKEFEIQTGIKSSKVATMRRFVNKFDETIVVRGMGFDFRVFPKKKL